MLIKINRKEKSTVNTYLWYEKKNMKQLIKKIMVLFVMLFLFTGCINNKNDKKNKITSYLDTINMEDFEKMQRDNKTFLVYVGRPTCEACQLFEDRFLEDIKDMEEFKKIKYFDVTGIHENNDEWNRFKQKYSIYGTPAFISFEKGKIKNSYGWTKDGFDYEKFKKWLEEEL